MKLTISRKMWFGFCAVLVLLVITSILTQSGTTKLTDRYKDLLDDDITKINLVEEIIVIQKDMSTAVLEFVMFGKRDAVDKFDAEIEKGMTAARALIEKSTDAESVKLMKDLQTETEKLFENNNKIIELKTANKPFEEYAEKSSELNEGVLSILAEIKKIQEDNMADTRAELEDYEDKTTIALSIITVLAIVVGILISYFIGRSISKPIQKVTAGLEEIAKGNLAIEPIIIKNRDEVGVMATTFNKMSNDLQQIVSSVRDSSMQLAANAEELSASSEESLASSQMVAKSAEEQMIASEQQVNHMESSMSSMGALQQGVSEIAYSNDEMLQATDGVKILVTKGSSVVSEVAGQMETIHTTFTETTEIMKNMAKHSDEIQNITSLITDISEQTNLLALNAAIEAARAGEYGKGFAVVAEEVRKLAEQSKNSASEIESMVQLIRTASGSAVKAITTGGDKVEQGLAKTTESLNVFNEIETSVGDVVQKVELVSTAIGQIQEMANSVTESAGKVQTLATQAADGASDTSAATEQQLAANEEISSNAQSLADLAEKLQNEVSHFKL
ncbi:methyl-accepting chemotaxis protein [Psychrobacillus psychrodurans]|uniref:methyl-accepting chemotaxis protein n=1 Tax=Psychrobacillus psychrodurans TaxID=126157 RepID=UPI0008ED3F17|nr:methyl-accepting chemotaxis protein [Psychrobacillus psychrodurans]MCZ8539229.1 methyl-accepting chemotaxis protein [Psychrobacillus psychrodurans]SFM34455.1 methyl-accepting chemotaxis protein [Psychrobacillus psychrodurans]